MADRILLAFVYGSMARQEDKAESDIDLMVIGEVKLGEILDRLSLIAYRPTRVRSFLFADNSPTALRSLKALRTPGRTPYLS